MKYTIRIIFDKLKTAKKIKNYLEKSKVYNSSEFMSIEPIKELCEECVNHGK